jgi:hypothetical protein
VWLEQWDTLNCKYCGEEHTVTLVDGRWECDNCQYGLEPETYLLLDGHNRYAICTEQNIAFTTQVVWLKSREEAINWIIANQLGRRNLTEEQKSYLRGKRYQSEKQQEGRPKKLHQNDIVSQTTHERLAQEYHVSPMTIARDGQFATALDTLEAQVRQDIRNTVLRRAEREQGRITKKQVTTTGKLVQEQTVTPQPFMRREGWRPYQVLEAIEILGTLPADEHEALNTLMDQPFIAGADGLEMLKNLQAMPATHRQDIYRLQVSPDPREQSLAKTLAAQKPPEQDPQVLLARRLIHDAEAMRLYQRKNWRDKFPDEPWTPLLDSLDGSLVSLQEQWQQIAAQARTRHAERIARYATPVTP